MEMLPWQPKAENRTNIDVYILKHLYYQDLSNPCITISILDLWRFHIGSNVLLIWIFSIKNFLYNFFSRLVDITRVLSLIVIKPLLEDNLVYVNSLTFIFNHGFDFPLLYIKLQLEDSLFYVNPVTYFQIMSFNWPLL